MCANVSTSEHPAQVSTTLLEAALSYARRGWPVFPCRPRAKQPLTPHGVLDATTDEGIIRAWWQRWPDANVAIRCGQAAGGLVVVDIDGDEGRASLTGHPLPPTPISQTGGGGWHYAYRTPTPLRPAVGLLSHVDIRAEDSYVVAPPSLHPNGQRYAWLVDPADTPLALLPAWVLDMTKGRRQEAEPIPEIISEGQRNDTLASLAGTMRRRGTSQAAIEAALLVENERCQPPLDEAEVRQIARSISHYPPAVDLALASKLSDPVLLPELATRPLTDAGNAECLYAMHSEAFRYVRTGTDAKRGHWLAWGQHRWERDSRGQVEQAAVAMARARLAAAQTLTDDKARKTAEGWAKASEKRAGVENTLALGRVLFREWATLPEDYDRDPWLLACTNGVLDLRTGQLRPGQPGDCITLSTGLPYQPTATAPRWERFLREVFAGDEELVRYVQKAVGYSLTGDTSVPALFLCWGTGRNGKSTLLNTIRTIAGDHGHNAPFTAFEQQQRAGVPNDAAAMAGKRLVTASETREGTRLNEARIKAMTGRDPITARFLFGEWFTYQPTQHVWLAMNHRPTVSGQDEALWHRLKLIPFTVSFAGREERDLADTLNAELPGILAWAVQGALLWRAEGLDEPQAVKMATADYRADSNTVGQFLADKACCVLATNAYAVAGELRTAFERWARENGLDAKDLPKGQYWANSLRYAGLSPEVKKIAGKTQRVWRGVGLIGTLTQGELA